MFGFDLPTSVVVDVELDSVLHNCQCECKSGFELCNKTREANFMFL